MAELTESMVHYSKLSILNWNQLQERYRVNHSIRFTSRDNLLKYTWHFTREFNEMWNSVEHSEDRDWEGFQWAEQQWRELRRRLSRNVVLWVAKASHSKKFVPGQIQPTIRVPKTVSLLVYIPSEQSLIQMVRMEQWQRDFEFFPVTHTRYNMISTWMNPETSVASLTSPGGW